MLTRKQVSFRRGTRFRRSTTLPAPGHEELARHYREGKIDGQNGKSGTAPAPGVPLPTNQKQVENVDGVRFLLHQGGCGGTREDSENLLRTNCRDTLIIQTLRARPVFSLGCQQRRSNRAKKFGRQSQLQQAAALLEQQRSGSEIMMSEAIRQTFDGLVEAEQGATYSGSDCRICVWD